MVTAAPLVPDGTAVNPTFVLVQIEPVGLAEILTDGVVGADKLTAKVDAALVPQALVAVTETLPLVALKVTTIEFVP